MQARFVFRDRIKIDKDILDFCRESPRSAEEISKGLDLGTNSASKYTLELVTNDLLKAQIIKFERYEKANERYFATDSRGKKVTHDVCKFKQRDNLVYEVGCKLCYYNNKCIGYNEFFKSSQRF